MNKPARLHKQPEKKQKPPIPWTNLLLFLILIVVSIIAIIMAIQSKGFYWYNYGSLAFIMPIGGF